MNIAFVPIRSGSKSIPFKNVKLLCGKPLVYWSLNALQQSKNIDEIVVAIDCIDFKNTVESFNFSKVSCYWREAENAEDTSSTESVMLEYIKKSALKSDDLFILVQATSPFTKALDFDQAVELMHLEQSNSLLSCVKTKRFFWDENAKPINYDFKNRPRRQDFDGMLMENGAFYISYVQDILKSANRLSGKISVYEMPDYSALEIDEEIDWILAETILSKYVDEVRDYSKIKLFLSDVDGTLTDAGMYYDSHGNESKKFNTHDGMAFNLLKNVGIKTGILTSENTKIVENRAKKLKVDYLYQSISHNGKLDAALEICEKEGISLEQVAYIGDDINCKELLLNVGFGAAPLNATTEIINLPDVIKLSKKGGDGAVREFVEIILGNLIK
jgi:N-acylneuraminate cytidylyltransferase